MKFKLLSKKAHHLPSNQLIYVHCTCDFVIVIALHIVLFYNQKTAFIAGI